MHPKDVREGIWQDKPESFEAAIRRAEQLIAFDDIIAGNALAATTWYSRAPTPWALMSGQWFRWQRQARAYAWAAYRAIDELGFSAVTPSQCLTVADILRHDDPSAATRLYEALLSFMEEASVTDEALAHVGIAEAAGLGLRDTDPAYWVGEALKLEERLGDESDHVQARRQWMRVLRRAAFVHARVRGHKNKAFPVFWEAWRLARSEDVGNRSQRIKLWVALPLLAWRLALP